MARISANTMPRKTPKKPAAKKPAAKRAAAKPVLLSGGNPQIAKAYGDAPVKAYIAAMPGWKRGLGRRLAHHAHRPRRAQGGQMEHAALRDRGECLVSRLSLHHEIREGGFLPRRVAATSPARRVQAEGRALLPYPRGRRPRRGSVRRLGEASQPIAGRTNVSFGYSSARVTQVARM